MFMDAQNDVGSADPLTWHAVYIIGAEELIPIKIGRTKDVWRRIEQMQTGNPYRLNLYGAFWGKKAAVYSLEWHVHKVLREFGLCESGEWFSVEPEIAEELVRKIIKDRGLSLMEIDAFRAAVMEPSVCTRAHYDALRGVDNAAAAISARRVDCSKKSL